MGSVYISKKKPLWLPSQLSTAKMWHDATDLSTITQSGDDVTSWTDKIGSNDVTQSAGATAPHWGASFLRDGLTVVEFDGTDDLMSVTATDQIGASSDFWMFIAAYTTTAVAFDCVACYGTNTSGARVQMTTADGASAAVPQPAFGNGVIDYNTSYTAGASGLALIYLNIPNGAAHDNIDAASAQLGGNVCRLNGSDMSGTAVGSTANTMSWATTGNTITFGLPFSGETNYWAGGLSQSVIGFGGSLSEADIEKLEGWAAWKLGRSDLLPGGHTYASSAPRV